MWKRAFDVIGSLAGLAVLSPLLLLVAACVKLSSRGPVFFTQERMGRGLRPFFIYKFRSMVADAACQGGAITVGEDPRITRVGRVLRKLKLDELPQLLNVLKGEMSFVGPRPEVRKYVNLFRRDFAEILQVRPGITDLASICYRDEAAILGKAEDSEAEYTRHVLPRKIRLARAYLRRGSLWFDLIVIARTLQALIVKRKPMDTGKARSTSMMSRIRAAIVRPGRIGKDALRFSGAKRVLDVGCGRGFFLQAMSGRGVGVDGSGESVRACRELGLEAIPLQLPARLPFPDGHFDGVYCSHLLEHFAPNDASEIMKEIDRVLAPGGIVLIRSPLFGRAFFDDPTHVRPYHLHCVMHFLGGWEEAGTRQMVLGTERPRYRLLSYYEECYPYYTSTVAPTIASSRFPFRLGARAIFQLLARFGIGVKGAYGALLEKTVSASPSQPIKAAA